MKWNLKEDHEWYSRIKNGNRAPIENYRDASPEQVEALSHSWYAAVRVYAAASNKVSTQTVDRLLRDPDLNVVLAAVSNPKASEKILNQTVEKYLKIVTRMLNHNEHQNVDSEEAAIISQAAHNPRLFERNMLTIAEQAYTDMGRYHNYARNLSDNPNATAVVFHRLATGETITWPAILADKCPDSYPAWRLATRDAVAEQRTTGVALIRLRQALGREGFNREEADLLALLMVRKAEPEYDKNGLVGGKEAAWVAAREDALKTLRALTHGQRTAAHEFAANQKMDVETAITAAKEAVPVEEAVEPEAKPAAEPSRGGHPAPWAKKTERTGPASTRQTPIN